MVFDEVRDLHRCPFQRLARRLAHGLPVENREGAEIEEELLAAEEQVGRHVEIVGQRQRLEHRLDAGLARVDRAAEVHFLAVEDDLAAGGLLDAGDLAHEGRFSGAVVAHDGDMLALAQLEIGVLQRMHAAIIFGEAFGLEDDVRHVQPLRPSARAAAYWSSTTAATMITPFTIS